MKGRPPTHLFKRYSPLAEKIHSPSSCTTYPAQYEFIAHRVIRPAVGNRSRVKKRKRPQKHPKPRPAKATQRNAHCISAIFQQRTEQLMGTRQDVPVHDSMHSVLSTKTMYVILGSFLSNNWNTAFSQTLSNQSQLNMTPVGPLNTDYLLSACLPRRVITATLLRRRLSWISEQIFTLISSNVGKGIFTIRFFSGQGSIQYVERYRQRQHGNRWRFDSDYGKFSQHLCPSPCLLRA